ncbi:unnamed protein product [Urochloa humidicola]
MADSSIQQVSTEDPPNVLKRNTSEGANRVRRCRSTPTDTTDQKPVPSDPTDQKPTPSDPTDQKPTPSDPTDQKPEPAEHGSVLQSKELFKEVRPSFILVGLLLFVYLVVGAITFYIVMDQISGKRTNRVLDALYFVVITMTSVGYGDLVPKSDTTKLLACAFVFIGMGLIALFISKVADYLVEKQKVLFYKALHMDMKGGDAKMLRAMETNRTKYKFYSVALLLAMVMVAGTVFLWKVEKLSFVDSFYCVCATITALGYGDKSFSSKLGRVFAIFWIITSTAVLAQFFVYLAELYTERRQKMLAKWVLNRRITTMDLEAADLDGDRQVDAAEFILYKLKELGKISQDDIYSFLEEFDKLDVEHAGTLSTDDLTIAQTSR